MLSGLRLVAALLISAILVYWTVERFLGEGDDPTLRSSMSSDTGSASVLLSGTKAIAAVAGAAAVLLLAPIGGVPAVANPAPILAFLGAIVATHWIVEKEERE